MTAKIAYKKEFYSLLSNVAEMLKNYVQETHKKKIHIVALPLFILLSSAGNTKILQDETNTTNAVTCIQTLTLTTPQTHFTRVKLAGEYRVVVAEAKVMASYADGKTEEVTDKVTWQGRHGKVAINAGKIIFYDENNLTLKASYKDVESNPLNFIVQNAEHIGAYLYAKIYNEISEKFPKRGAGTEVRLLKEPKEDVYLTVRLNSSDKVGFEESDALTKTLYFKAGEGWDRPQAVTIIDKDDNNTQPYTLYTDAFESNDTTYDGIDPKDIIITPHTSIEFIEPPLRKRKGAIRGVTVKILLYAKVGDVKTFRLIDPPKGVRLENPPLHTINEFNDMSRSATTIVWDVPMDIEEKSYDITIEAVDTEGKKGRITFPIKVPKTTPIQTTLKNNELTVTDKSSPLFGMKMKGHSGEDVSNVRLRSVDYGDVWKARGKGKHTVFVIYNKPPKLNIDLPGDLKNGLSKSMGSESVFFSSDAWKTLSPECVATEQWDGKSKFGEWFESHCKMQRNSDMYDNGGNIIYMLYTDK